MNLDDKAYQLLKERCTESTSNGKQDWYEKTYPIFVNHQLQTMEDFWKIMAFAYSWMPTIPKFNTSKNVDEKWLLTSLDALKNRELNIREELLNELVPIINNSLVGTSKVLHFIAPSFVPIIDSRVLRGWKKFSEKFPEYNIPQLPSPNVALNKKHVGQYILYWDTLLRWQEQCRSDVKLRDFEKRFYEFGIK